MPLKDSAKYDEGIDYTVLSIGVQTLALILFVEIVKHKLDHFADGRKFFGTVLHSMYNELSTLGIVELVVYLTLKYLRDYDQAKKSVFADVHFCLFYIAVFNAFQTVIVAAATRRTSKRKWVDTEHLELDHYVEIREEFQRIKEKLGYSDDDDGAEEPTIQNFFQNCIQSIKNPGLRGRYVDLLVQVNFHSLRLHFLHSNDLPLTLKVSDYLKRSEEKVLAKLVHVSGGAWLMLTGCLSLVYFLMGMVAYVSEDQEVVGLFLKGIFFFMLLIFIVISVAVYFKMKSTFHTIITTKYKMSKLDDETRATGMKNQKDLFWLGEPQFVISMIQFMQFGYALALAVVLMYWTSFTTFEPYYFLLAVVVCYSIFVFILSETLPQYTLCTSLGYLIDEGNLLETVALNRLEEARRLRIQQMAETKYEGDSMISFESSETSITRTKDFLISDDPSQITAALPSRNSILAELVQSDTQSLRTLLPDSFQQSLRDRESRRLGKRKSLSDGVGSMRLSLGSKRDPSSFLFDSQPSSGYSGGESHQTVDDSQIINRQRAERAARRRAQKRAVSASSVIQTWQSITEEERKREGDSVSKQLSIFSDSSLDDVHNLSASMGFAKNEQSSIRQPASTWDVSTKDRPESEARSTAKTVESDYRDESKLVAPERTDDSVGALSDVDVQDWTPSEHATSVEEKRNDCSFKLLLFYTRNYFLGRRYHTFSHVFGSLVCFFLVGHRVEVMLSTTGAIEPSTNTWELDLGISFWAQAIWYVFFILASILILSLFLPIKDKSLEDKTIITAGAIDFLLSGGCLAILFLAETQRCCDNDEFERDEECCPFWGSRTHGGLGDIEPFTSLIGLRVFRFVTARYLVKYFGQDAVDGKTKEQRSRKKHIDGHGGGYAMESHVGTPLELWEKAITKYPAIVEKYGELSGELFQAMLGLEVLDGKSSNAVKENKKSRRRSIRLSGSMYNGLPADAQSIIVAGKLGKPVKTLPNLLDQNADLPALAEETDQSDLEQGGAVKSQPTLFEIDNERLLLEDIVHSSFVAPNARLIRSMRRCDRKMLPILTEWECVDIVLTQFECVYFEAFDPQLAASKTHDEECSLLALQATGGGKGLRLQDVARGRKIIGHMKLSEVNEIHVERSMPLSDALQTEDISTLSDSDDQLSTEFWLRSEDERKATACRKARWERIKEDRLKLISSHGCLVLRFFSDLEYTERHAESYATENEAHGPLRKNVAFQWAQTVTHICGKEKLHQSLPHFGENNSDELRDLLELANNHEKEHSAVVRNLKGENRVVSPVKPIFRRSQSMESSGSGMKGRIRRRFSLSSSGTQYLVSPKDGVVHELQDTVTATELNSEMT